MVSPGLASTPPTFAGFIKQEPANDMFDARTHATISDGRNFQSPSTLPPSAVHADHALNVDSPSLFDRCVAVA